MGAKYLRILFFKKVKPLKRIVIRGLSVVEVTGLEPAESCSQSRRATNCATPRNLFNC